MRDFQIFNSFEYYPIHTPQLKGGKDIKLTFQIKLFQIQFQLFIALIINWINMKDFLNFCSLQFSWLEPFTYLPDNHTTVENSESARLVIQLNQYWVKAVHKVWWSISLIFYLLLKIFQMPCYWNHCNFAFNTNLQY